eukprot:scaffold36454_cov68-Phaeocystis_antarctica.AAC.12
MQILPQVAWPVAQLTTQSSSSSISAASDAGSDRTSSSSSTSPQRKRNSESRDADEAPPCENASTAASSLLMLFEEEGKPAVAPMPFFQFPRIAPAVLTSAPPFKRTCFSFGKKAPSVLLAWPQRGGAPRAQPIARGEASPCSPRACHRSPITSESVQETMSQMVRARLSSGSTSGEQLDEPAAWTHASSAAAPTPLAT